MEIVDLNIELPDKGNVSMMFEAFGTVADVINKVCQKFKLKHDDYELRYEGRVLAAEKVLWECGLPLGARLILTVKHKSPVIIVDLLIQGTCFTHFFSPSATLWEVCQDFMKDKPNPTQPVEISYLGHCFHGKDVLKKTKLSSLSRRKDKIILQLEKKWAGIVDQKCNINNNLSTPERHEKFGKKPTRKNMGKETLEEAVNNEQMIKSGELEDHKIDDKGSSNKRKEETSQKTFVFPRHSTQLKGITTIDTNHYTSIWEKPRSIIHLDERKGLTYSLKNKGTFGKTGLALLGLKEDENKGSFISLDNEIQLKIVFPQQTVIQASFKQNETLADVYSFLSSFVRSPNIVLCGSKDTKCDLDRSTHVKDLHCTPEGTIYIRYTSDAWKSQPIPINLNLLKPQLLTYKGKKRIWKLK